MRKLIVTAALLLSFTVVAQPAAAIVHRRTLAVPDVGTITYGISVPSDYDPKTPIPLVLSLHPGEFAPYYGTQFMMGIIIPGLRDFRAIVVAPDCPGKDWAAPGSEKAVMALLQSTLDEFTIDKRRILVAGYSMGGRGTWFMESQHADLFTGALVMAGSPRDLPVEKLAMIPTYIIHSRADERVPFEPAAQVAGQLEKMGRVVKFQPLEGLSHGQMPGYVEPMRQALVWMTEAWAK